jgi:hypothetical protein
MLHHLAEGQAVRGVRAPRMADFVIGGFVRIYLGVKNSGSSILSTRTASFCGECPATKINLTDQGQAPKAPKRDGGHGCPCRVQARLGIGEEGG